MGKCVFKAPQRAYKDQMLIWESGKRERKYIEDLPLTCILFSFLKQITNLNPQKQVTFLLRPSWKEDIGLCSQTCTAGTLTTTQAAPFAM